jgi:hypothetical protein
MKIFRSYYLPWFIGLSIIFGLKILFSNSPNSLLNNIIFCLSLSLGISGIVGTLYYFEDTNWGPKRRIRKMKKSPFKEFLELGFTEGKESIVGKIEGYTITVTYLWIGYSGKPSIDMRIFFNPIKNNSIIPKYYFKELSEKYKRDFLWNINGISYEWEFNFFPTKFSIIMNKIKDGLAILKKENLGPIGENELEKLIPEMEKQSEKEKYTRD